MLPTPRLATARRELPGTQVSPVPQSLSVWQRCCPNWQTLEASRLVVATQASLGKVMQNAPLLHCESVVHLGVLQSSEQMPRQWLPLPQSESRVQEVALLLLQNPRQLPLQSLS